MYILDTNVVSELRRIASDRRVLDWIEGVPLGQQFLSAVTVGEIQFGIEKKREHNAQMADELASWLNRVLDRHTALPMDKMEFRVWARFKHQQPNASFEDAMIAATASVHEMTVVTRNVRDFRDFDVELLDPFSGQRIDPDELDNRHTR